MRLQSMRRRPNWIPRAGALALVLLAASTLWSSPLAASERSERLYTRGLVELHAGRVQESLTLFDRAVQADPNDAYALYYRGVARGRVGDREGGIADLQAALERHPDLPQAAGDIGVLLLESERYEEALQYLAQAERSPEGGGRATLMRGIALLRLRRFEEAGAHFERAGRDPVIASTAAYYRGVAAYEAENWDAAETHFRAAAGMSPGSQVAQEAERYLERLRARQIRPYRLYAEAGLQYDSNVCLVPDDGDNTCLNKGSGDGEDGRGVFTVGGLYAPIRSEKGYIAVGYEFFQSLHFDLNQFDLQDHRPSLQAVVNRGPVQFGVYGRYDYYLRDNHKFLQEGNVIPWIALNEGNVGRTELYYRMRRRDFRESDFEQRDSFNHSTGAMQYIYLGSQESYASVGYRYDAENPTRRGIPARQFSYDGNEVNTAVRWLWPFDVSTFLGYAFRYEQYDGDSTFVSNENTFRRRDKEHRLTFLTEIPINQYIGIEPYVAIAVGYFGTFNNSNKNDPFEYTRNIASFTLRAAY